MLTHAHQRLFVRVRLEADAIVSVTSVVPELSNESADEEGRDGASSVGFMKDFFLKFVSGAMKP
jgi:hypothetical protein